MTTLTVNQIEEQFAHLSSEDQSFLLEQLAQPRRLGVAESNSFPGRLAEAVAAGREIQREMERVESRSAESDLLREAW